MTFRFRLIITISLLIALTFGIGGTVLISASFDSALREERTSALKSFESVQNTLVLLTSLSDQTDLRELSETLARMDERGMADWQAISLKRANETLYQSGAEMLGADALALPDAGKCAFTEVSDRYGYSIILLGSLSVGQERLALEARFDLSSVYAARDRHWLRRHRKQGFDDRGRGP